MSLATKTKKLLLLSLFSLVLLLTIVGAVWYTTPETLTPGKQPTTTQSSHSENAAGQTGSSSPAFNTYENQEFGFSFNYPRDWDIRMREFYSPNSLLNLGIKPIEEMGVSPIVINLTPKQWVENALVKMRARGVTTTETTLNGRPAIRLHDKDRISRPATTTLLLVDDEFWIDITGVNGGEKVYNMILESFEID